ncbi:MAG: peptidase domain-containing ABC transporter, partial [Crocosphaera sp.]
MVQIQNPVISRHELTKALGFNLSEKEFSQLRQQIKIIEPQVGLFWETTKAEAGLYIVIAGKARLVNQSNEKICTLEIGDTFGECQFFIDENLEPYGIRASLKTKLCYLSPELLFPLISKYPQIREHFYQQAKQRDNQLNPAVTTAKNTNVYTNLPSEKSSSNSQKIINKAYFPSPTQRVSNLLQKVWRRYPFYTQQSASDCGAACLAMIARYWGKKLSINRLRDMANVDRNGASLKGLCRAAESIGFAPRPVKASLDKLAEQALPAIVHWEGNHYIVVYEITKKEVVIADPAIGQKTISHSKFKENWTGYTLLLKPTISLKDTKESTTPFWQFFELVKPHGLVLFEIFIASLFIQIFGLITPIFTQLILDRVVVQRSGVTLFAVGLGLIIFGLFRVAMMGLRQYLLDHTANKIDITLIVAFINHTLRLPLGFFESRYVGDIISRVQENRKIKRFLTGEALSILLDLLTVFIYVGLMFWYNWKMALVSLAIVPLFFLLALIATPFLKRISREIFGSMAKEQSYLIEALRGVRTIKSSAVERSVRWHWEELLHQKITTQFSGQVIGNRLQIFSNSIEALATTILLWYGAWLVMQNQLTIGQLVAFNMLFGNVIRPFQRLTVLWEQLQEVVIAVERLNDVLDYEPEEDLQQQSRQILPRIQGHIRFDNVTFRYHPESDINVLENLNFEIKPGQTVALVGRSGSGKTTISKLVLGLYPATDGK